jgi:hypothetical protein
LEYLAICLSIRDRKEIIEVLCRSQPDHVTEVVRTAVSAYDPVIREIHNTVDLSDTVSDLQAFIGDMIKLSKIPPPEKDGETAVPTVGDFVQLLRKHQYSCHKFLHQCCKNGKELSGWYLDWAKKAASQFRRDRSDSAVRDVSDLTEPLSDLFSKLPTESQSKIVRVLDQQIRYLDEMHASSRSRLEAVLQSPPSKNPTIAKIVSSPFPSRPPSRAPSPNRGSLPVSSIKPGPGAYLTRWQDLLDETQITPLSLISEVESGSSKEVLRGSAKDVDGEKMTVSDSAEPHDQLKGDGNIASGKPDVGVVVKALGKDFRVLLARLFLESSTTLQAFK